LDELSAITSDYIKTGRTHLQDASAVTFGGEFKGYADELRTFVSEADFVLSRLRKLNLGGTAVGTGANLPQEMRNRVYRNLNEYYKENFIPADNLMTVMQFISDFNRLASLLSGLSSSLIKISRDLRLMNSGPVAGFNEIVVPAVQPGSSIMPGKVNPSILEALTMSALFARGLVSTVSDAASQGEMEINVFTPVIYTAIMEAFDVLTVALGIMEEKALKGIKINSDYAYEVLLNSPGTALLLNPVIGYEKTAEIVNESKEKKESFLKLLREKKILTDEQINKIFSKENMLNK
jgi:fumarate hydratase class II/aspartate ammonia-lyase